MGSFPLCTVTYNFLNLESEHNTPPINYAPPDSETSSHMVKVSTVILQIDNTFTHVIIVHLCTFFVVYMITNSTSSLQTQIDESPFITVLCKKCHCHYPLKQALHQAQKCTHLVNDLQAKDSCKQFPQVKAGTTCLI